MSNLDVLIPVYNEGENIVRVLRSLQREVRTPFRVLICYDSDDDNTLPAVKQFRECSFGIQWVKNQGRGAHGAVTSGFRASTAPAVIVYPADDDHNAAIVDKMYEQFQAGCDIVAASRFMAGGAMVGCRWQKALWVRLAAFTLYHLAGIPTHDASNGFRLFTRRVLDSIEIESQEGFTYSIELLVKVHRLGWKVGEVPAQWFERPQGTSRFRVLHWAPAYLRWYFYAFGTTWLHQGFETVKFRVRTGP